MKTPEQKARAEWRRKNMTIRIARFDDVKNEPDPPVHGTMAELMELTLELSMMACALGGKYDTEHRLQRNIINIIRPQC